MSRVALIAAVSLLLLAASEPTDAGEPQEHYQLVQVGAVVGVIVPAIRCPETYLVKKRKNCWTPSEEDVTQLELRLPAALERVRRDPRAINKWVEDPMDGEVLSSAAEHVLSRLHDLRRQYVGIIVRGRRKIYVNGFPNPGVDDTPGPDYWKNTFRTVFDGGPSYWRIQYDVADGTFHDFHANGVR